MFIKLANPPGNLQMLNLISAAIGGYVSITNTRCYNYVPSVTPSHNPAPGLPDFEVTGQLKIASKSKQDCCKGCWPFVI